MGDASTRTGARRFTAGASATATVFVYAFLLTAFFATTGAGAASAPSFEGAADGRTAAARADVRAPLATPMEGNSVRPHWTPHVFGLMPNISAARLNNW